MNSTPRNRRAYRDIFSLAWPVFISQLAIMVNGVIDTVMAGRSSSADLAAVGLGVSIYITVYVAAMGVILALMPIAAQHYGAGRLEEIGEDFKQSLWMALFLAVPGCLLLGWTEPWLAFSQPPPEVAQRTTTYLWAVALGLPAALLFRAYYALNNAVSRPKAVMAINLIGVVLKVPMNALFMQGWSPDWLPVALHLDAMGGPGCGVSTAVIAWLTVLVALGWLLLDPWYRRLHLRGMSRPSWTRIRELLRLGVPIGASYLVEVSSFTFMALFVARFGPTVASSHQIASNIAGVVFMVALAVSNATSVLVAQSIGAEDRREARRMVARGGRLAILLALGTSTLLWLGREPITHGYSADAAVIAATLPLITLVAIFHVFDASQTFIAYTLRAYKIATLPMVIYIVTLWGIGLGGGWLLTFRTGPDTVLGAFNGTVGGATGFWVAGIASLLAACVGLGLVLARTLRSERALQRQASAPGGVRP